jgi:hypothetical protein
VFSWGSGTGGRLGHGDSRDQHAPKEVRRGGVCGVLRLLMSVRAQIAALRDKRVQSIACGHVYSAAVTGATARVCFSPSACD